MHQKRSPWPGIAAFCLILLLVPLYWLFGPEKTFSPSERRYLAERPDITKQDVQSWTFDQDAESFLADHLPLRDMLAGIYAYFTLLTGRQVSGEVWMDREGYLLSAPFEADQADLDKRMTRLNRFADTVQLPVTILIIPGHGWVRRAFLPPELGKLYKDPEITEKIRSALQSPGLSMPDTLALFDREGQGWFYRTDHHWTADGARAAADLFLLHRGMSPLSGHTFIRSAYKGYTGSTRSRSALWLTPADTLETDDPGVPLSVTFQDKEGVYDSLFFKEHLASYDFYPLFLDGNHSVTEIDRQGGEKTGRVLMLVKDSFGNSLAPLLVPFFDRIVMVDPRYCRKSISGLCEECGATEVLFCYSLERFCTDLNLLLLK